MTSWYEKTYLLSDHWKRTRDEHMELAEGKCEMPRCYNDATQIHHLNYACLWHETSEDLMALCGDCHLRIHGRQPRAPRLLKAANDNWKPLGEAVQGTLWDLMNKQAS